MSISKIGTDGLNQAGDTILCADSGNVGVGNGSPTYKVDVSGTGRFTGSLSVLTGATDTAGLIVGGDTNPANTWTIARDSISTGDLKFISNATERARITAVGNLLVGQTTNVFNSRIVGQSDAGAITPISLHDSSGGATSHYLGTFYRATALVGSITITNTGVSYNTSSDYRLKENAVNVVGASERVQQLKPVRFNFIANPEITVDGFLAHEAQAVVPEAVTGAKDAVDADGNPEYQGIDQSKLVPLLTAALQEALAAIDDLTARVSALEA